MKKKMLILFSILLIIIVIIIIGFSYTHTSKKNADNSKNVPELESENNVHNSEKNGEQVENEEKKEINESYTQSKDEKYDTSKNNAQQSNDSSSNQNNNSSNSNSAKNNNTKNDSNISAPPQNDNQKNNNDNQKNNNDNQKNNDEATWNDFKSDPLTLMILDADAPDWETKAEQEAEAKKWINLGYRVEEPYACIDLSNGKRCVYSLLVYMPKGVCNETPDEISIDWRNKNYIGIVSYAKSLGYSCEGYQD